MTSETYPSPDGLHRVFLTHTDGRNEHLTYSVRFDGRKLPDVLVTRDAVWSPDSRFIMAQRCLSIGSDPVNAVTIIDFQTQKVAHMPARLIDGGFGFAGTADSYEAFAPDPVTGERTAFDLSALDWADAHIPPPLPPEPPYGPIDADRLNRLAAARQPFLEAAKRLVALGNPIKDAQKFWDDVAGHQASLARGETPLNPITFDRLGCLDAYAWRLEQREDPLALELRAVIDSLDRFGNRATHLPPAPPSPP